MRNAADAETLRDLRVAVTRSGAGSPNDRLTCMLAEGGARPVPLPLTSTEPPTDRGALDMAVRRMESYDWLVVTSARAVPPLLNAARRAAVSITRAREKGLRICPVGPATGEALAESGLTPDVVPERFRAEGVVTAILSRARGRRLRVLFPRAEQGRETIPRRLREAGAEVHVVAAYRTAPLPGAGARLASLVSEGSLDALTFTAGSAARVFLNAWARHSGELPPSQPGAGLAIPPDVGVVTIGPATASVLRAQGIRVDRVASPHTLEGLRTALAGWWAGCLRASR